MPHCYRCQQLVDEQAVLCPHCKAPLKAFGHPGIPLYRAETQGEEFLCDRCLYHEDNTCNFPQRPYAKTCTLFRDRDAPLKPSPEAMRPTGIRAWKAWLRRNRGLLLLLVIVVLGVLLAFVN